MGKIVNFLFIFAAIISLWSCWMLNEVYFTYSAAVTQNFNGTAYDPVHAVIDWQSEFQGEVALTFTVKSTTADSSVYSASDWMDPVCFRDIGTFTIDVNTEGKQMQSYTVGYLAQRK